MGEGFKALPEDELTTDANVSVYFSGKESINNFRWDRDFGSGTKGLTSQAPGTMGGLAQGACPMVHTTTPKVAHALHSVGRAFNRRNRKMWSRVIDGLRLPGRCYFLTFTTTPNSPSLPALWNGLRQWLKRSRPGICWLYCFTMEGGLYHKGSPGVIHMVIRLHMKQKNLDINEVRAYWKERTGASQLKILRVPESKKEDLADYIANQRNKVRMAREMGYQSAVARWHWSKGWLPKGYGKSKSKLWGKMLHQGVPDEIIKEQSVNLLHKMYHQEVKNAL